jgi:hypothetical protein
MEFSLNRDLRVLKIHKYLIYNLSPMFVEYKPLEWKE